MIKLLNNKKGSAIIIIVFLALMGFLGVTLLASDIIKSNLIMSNVQLNSTKAYFAAEVGLEEALWEVMQGDYELPENTEPSVFSNTDVANIENFLDQGRYSVRYNRANSVRTFVSKGGYLTQNRSTEVSFCIPFCEGKDCGVDDGCGVPCPPACETDLGCQESAPANSTEVDGTGGVCCSGFCYECNDGYFWNGTECQYSCIQQCNGLACGQLDGNCGLPCPASCDTDPGCMMSSDPAPPDASDSGGSCCDIAGSSYTCYSCDEGFVWDGSACFDCVDYEGDPYPGSTVCFDNGVYDCFGGRVEALQQPAKGLSCVGGNEPLVTLSMNEGTGIDVNDSSSFGNDGIFRGNNWMSRKEIIIDHTKFTKNFENFQFLLDITDIDLYYYAQNSGNDIFFRDENGAKIPHEVESYIGNTGGIPPADAGHLVAWLKIPVIYASKDTKIYMYYNNPAAISQQDKVGVWSGHAGVWHLKNESRAYNSIFASDSYGFYGGTGSLPNSVAGAIGYGQNSIVTVGTSYGWASTVVPAGYSWTGGTMNTSSTLSSWVKVDSANPSSSYAFILNQSYVWSSYGQYFYFSNGRPSVSNHAISCSADKNIADGLWHQVVYVAGPGANIGTFYIDGVFDSTKTNCPKFNNYFCGGSTCGTSLYGGILGSSYCGTSSSPSGGWCSFKGQLDELRLSFNAHDAEYINMVYLNEVDPASFVTVGGKEDNSGTANWVSSIYGYGLEFNGQSNYINFINGSNILTGGDMTIEFWVNPSTFETTYLMSKSDGTWNLGFLYNNWPYFTYKSNNSGYSSGYAGSLYTGFSFPPYKWSHLAFTYKALTRQFILYANGVSIYTTNLDQPVVFSTGSLEVGRSLLNSIYFSGKMDELKVFNYVRTPAEIMLDSTNSVCNGVDSCVPLSAPLQNTKSSQSCNDICYSIGQQCSSVGTDTNGINGLMRIRDTNDLCKTTYADCSTVVLSNQPDSGAVFSCDGRETNWTNCNCTICDSNYGSGCKGTSCIVDGTGTVACDGTCSNPDYLPVGTSCGTYMECDIDGICRNTCHPQYTLPCGATQCKNPGTVSCDGNCDAFPKADGLDCVNAATPNQDECWAGVCEQCVPNLGQPCNDGECQNAGVINCLGGCSACINGDCTTNPSLTATGDPCEYSTYGPETGTCSAVGTCEACDSDYLNLGKVCNDEVCHVAGERSCETGICSSTAFEAEGNYCEIGGLPGACDTDGDCITCQPGYLDPCNDSTPCHKAGTTLCDGLTCSTSGYLDLGDYCDAGFSSSPNSPDTGTCDINHICQPCDTHYLNGEECNTDECNVSGFYTCGGGCDACVGDDCFANPHYASSGDFCETGATSDQPYTGTCDGFGTCDSCDQKYIDDLPCNTEECHPVGEYDCEGICSTEGQVSSEFDECDGGIYNGFPDRDTGYCDFFGACQTCKLDYIYNIKCLPTGVLAKDVGCYNSGTIPSCLGDCSSWSYKDAGTTCLTGVATTQTYSGKCDGAGVCVQCDDGFLNKTICNNANCQRPGVYNCEGDCSTEGQLLGQYSGCDAGITGTVKTPTGYCLTNGTCEACYNSYLFQTPCYPVGTLPENMSCINPGLNPNCYYDYCPGWSYKIAGLPCDSDGHECDGSGHCTDPLPIIIVPNYAHTMAAPYSSSISCQQICTGLPYAHRGCLDVGLDSAATDNQQQKSSSYSCYYDTVATCDTQILSTYMTTCERTNCRCGSCDVNYNKVCIAADQCNYESKYKCNGDCLDSFKANNLTCDPEGASIYGYCWYGACDVCPEIPGTLCNTDICYNQGTYNCQGTCSTWYNPYKAVNTVCATGSVCDGAGKCVVTDPKFNQVCPIVPPKDSECYNPGTYDYKGDCINMSTKNENSACTVNATSKEGRCIAGDCVECLSTYNQDCPIPPAYNAYCYSAGKYACLTPTCSASYFKNQGLYGCGTPNYICDEGKCIELPDQYITVNSASGKSCDTICSYYGRHCYSIGTNALADSGVVSREGKDKNGNSFCSTANGYCSDTMAVTSRFCSGADGTTHTTDWTNCLCTVCAANAWTSCAADPMWVGTTLDNECYDFGDYDCDGNCAAFAPINENAVCHNNSNGIEGRCSSGYCDQCEADYLNNVACAPNNCVTSTRECDGSCSVTFDLAIGETCGTGLECDVDGNCVPASTLPYIVVLNSATNRSCNSYCTDYPNRHCVSVGTDDTQAGGTNGYTMNYGTNNNIPYCPAQSGKTCSTIISKNPILGDLNYDWKCSNIYTNWTYCRCSNL